MASLPKFDLPVYVDNPTGWGPSLGNNGGTLDQFKGMPFQLFNKCDRVGRIIDWLGVDRYYKKSETRDRYNERIYGSSATAGGQYDYVHDNEDANFQLVDSSKPVRPQRTFRRPYGQFRNLAKKDQERRDAKNPKTSQKMNRAIAKEQMRQYKLWQRRGGGARNMGGRGPQRGRFGDRQGGKARQPSVQVRQEWKVLQELDFPQLGRLSLPNVDAAEDVPDESYGTLYFYDKSIDKVSVKNPIPLKRCGGTFYNITTTDDPVIQRLAQSGVGNVFATDMILATLMTTTRSANSWDIVAHKLGNKIFFDKRDTGDITNPVEALWVSETSPDPPAFEVGGINNAKDLATEALYINQNFRRQVIRRDQKPFQYKHASAPFEEDEGARADCGYRYRKWTLPRQTSGGQAITIVARTENDGAAFSANGDVQKISIKAFNEWDSSQANGVDWRSKLEQQPGAVLATEMKNNSCKLAKWTLQAILGGSDYIKFGYVSRANTRNSAQHVILNTQQYAPQQFAHNIGLNLDNCWGILYVIIDFLMKQANGKYLLLKDPLQAVVRIYSLPDKTFDSEDEASEEDSEDDEESGGEAD